MISVNQVFADSSISVNTNSKSYQEGDTIVISGTVSNTSYEKVTIQIFNQGNLVDIAQVIVAKDGSYSHTIISERPYWAKAGEYTITASFGEGDIAETTFNFSLKSGVSTSNIFEVDAGNQGTFDVGYSISGGVVKNMLVDKDGLSLIAIIESTTSGSISLDIPRESFDAKKQDQTDDTFIIIIDGIEAPYQETKTNSDSRTITINFEQGDSDIRIIGTFVIGEFLGDTYGNSGGDGILSDSVFRILPEKPSVGSMIRVAGDNFGANQKFDFFINTNKLGTFESDEYGRFITTITIPKTQNADRVDFIVKDAVGNEKKLSLRLGEVEKRIDSTLLSITISVLTDQTSYALGDVISISGTIQNSNDDSISLNVVDPDNVKIWKETVLVKENGKFSTLLIVGDDFAVNGQYVLTATDGRTTSNAIFSIKNNNDFPLKTATLDDLPYEIKIIPAQGSSAPGCEETSQGCYIPKVASVATDGKVIFSNTDTAAHTFTAGTPQDGPSGEFDTSLVIAGSSYEWTPTREGQYDYYCMVHPWMTGLILVGEGTYIPPQPEDDFDLQVVMGNQVYDLNVVATMNLFINGISTPQNVALEISDPSGITVISRSFMVDSEGIAFEFKIDENFKTGTYKVVATTTNNGNTIKETTYFKVKSQYNSFKITSVQVTDQQGNPSNLQAGEMGFIKVNLDASKSITTLVTVNLFDSELTSIGIGSIKTTLSSGNSEIILSFMIPSDVAVGSADIYVNAFSDWPSNGGIPLTSEVSITENIE